MYGTELYYTKAVSEVEGSERKWGQSGGCVYRRYYGQVQFSDGEAPRLPPSNTTLIVSGL